MYDKKLIKANEEAAKKAGQMRDIEAELMRIKEVNSML